MPDPVPMTGEQLRAIRGDRTREQFAKELGDCSPSTLNKWERNISPVPEWVREKALRKVPLTLPLDSLMLLLDYALEKDLSFERVLATAIGDYLAKGGPSKAAQHSVSSKAPVLSETRRKSSTAA